MLLQTRHEQLVLQLMAASACHSSPRCSHISLHEPEGPLQLALVSLGCLTWEQGTGKLREIHASKDLAEAARVNIHTAALELAGPLSVTASDCGHRSRSFLFVASAWQQSSRCAIGGQLCKSGLS